MDENLEELYDNLADPDDEEYYDSEDDEVEDEEYDEEDNIAEDPGDDEDWWHSGEDEVNEVIVNESSESGDETEPNEGQEYDDSIAQTVFEPVETITYTQTTEIESATTGRELFDAVADLLERFLNAKGSGRHSCDISFVTKSEFDSIPDEYKYLPENADWYEQTGDDDDDDVIDLSGDEKVPNVYFIVDAYD